MARRDFYTALVLTAFGAFVLVESIRMPRLEELGVNPYTVPGLVPGVLGVVLMIFGAILLVRSLRQQAPDGAPATASPGDGDSVVVTRLLLAIAVTVGYGAVLVGWLPFTLATFLFVTGFITLFETRAPDRRRSFVRIASVAAVEGVLVAYAVTFVFERIFLVRLP